MKDSRSNRTQNKLFEFILNETHLINCNNYFFMILGAIENYSMFSVNVLLLIMVGLSRQLFLVT